MNKIFNIIGIVKTLLTSGVFILLLSSEVFSQLPYIEKINVNLPGEEPVFTRALQDIDGYIWLGSDRGLFRFDGFSFKSFDPAEDSSEFHVSALNEDEGHTLWIGCRDGKIYRTEQGKIVLFNPEEGTAEVAITDILVAKDRTLWWSTAGEGIYFYSGSKVYNINHDDGLPDDYVYDLESDREGNVWAGTDGGVVSCNFRNGNKTVTPLAVMVDLPDIMVRVVKEDQQGRLWLGFQDGGTGFLKPDRSAFVQPDANQIWNAGPVNTILISEPSAWIGTSTGKLLEINASGNKLNLSGLLPEDLKPGKIHDLLKDSEGNIWILASSGLYRSTGNRLRFLQNIDGKVLGNIHAILMDEKHPGILWFGDDQGLYSFDIEKKTLKKYLDRFQDPGLKITCLNQDSYGYIWAGTFNYGIFRLNPENGTVKRITEKEGLVNDNVLSISRHEDTLWLATLGGASELVLDQRNSGKSFIINSFNYENGLANNFIYAVYEDKNDRIWLATDGDGINVGTDKGWITYDEKNGLTDDVIYSITGDASGNIWAASASRGIFKFDGKKFIRYALEEGLSSLAISGIATVDDEIVIINENGLDILHIPSGNITHYGEETGLAGIQPDLNVISTDADGNTWFGTRTGIIRYRAGSAVSYVPRTVLEEMLVYLEPRAMENDLELPYSGNHVTFRYAGLWYSNPEKLLYQVMLEGFDLGWKNTFDRQAVYSSLPPGKYTFKVRSSLDQTFVNADETAYSFRIRNPIWLQDWFIILLIMLLGGLIYLYITVREQRFRKKEQEKNEKIEFEFQVLKNQVNPHFLFNSFSTLVSLIEDQPEQAVQYTEKLSDFFRTILQYKDQKVIPVHEELALIESYFFLLKKRFGDNLNLDIYLDEKLKKTFIPPMTLQLLIENAVKHNIISKDKPLFIRIYEDEGRIVVENNLQPKLTAEVSTGIGLENIRKRYKLITQKEILLEKSDQIFKIILPVIS